MFNKLCIIGVGLIGGSVAKAVRKYGLANEIVGIGRIQDIENLRRAKDLGVIDRCHISKLLSYPYDRSNYVNNDLIDRYQDFQYFDEALYQADCVVIAIPVASMTMKRLLQFLKKRWSEDTVYTDVGSTKGNIIATAESVFGYVPRNLVPAHPIAGAEKSGVEASVDDLFEGKRLIITPTHDTDFQAIQRISTFWERLGSDVSIMDAQRHDSILAATSHLPHLLAFALVDMLGHKDEQNEIFNYAAGGFRDFTRIASSDPTMWADICMANKSEILPLIEQLSMELAKIHSLLANDDYQQLFSTFAYAKSARQRFLNQFEVPNPNS